MPPDVEDPFGEYAPETQTAGSEPGRETATPDEVEATKYGIGKPRRIIVKGTIAADKSPKN